MEQERSQRSSIILESAGILAILSSMTYLVVRGVLLERAKYSAVDGVFAVLILLAEAFILLHGIGYAAAILWSQKRSKMISDFSTGDRSSRIETCPFVAILIPARHEPREVLSRTFITINNIEYANKRIYFLDDSVKEEYHKEAEELARKFGLQLFRRTKPWHGAKAGIINDFLEQMTEKYVVIFDADSNPMPDFLSPLVPIMEANEKLAFIQTPQFYTNINTNRIARAAMLQQAVFYEYICDGKGTVDAMFCCGTNVILRVSALKAVGGMDERTLTEDFSTSLRLHAHGFSSLYYNHVGAFSMGPEDLNSYFTQQFRWASGTLQVLRDLFWLLLTRPFSLKPWQWFQYFLSSTYYLIGFAFFSLILGPLLYIFFKVPSFYASPSVYFLSFLPYVILSTSVFYFSLRKRNYKPWDLVLGQFLGAMTFLVYVQAALAVLSGSKLSFGVTSKVKGKAMSFRALWPQLAVLMLTFAAPVWAANRYVYEHEPSLIINGFWAIYQFLIFSTIFYFNRRAK
ncbi:MAG: glycosyltransferase [Candidatus Omnitrophota bacterium]